MNPDTLVKTLQNESQEAFRLLNSIFKNIIGHPTEEKYRHIKKTNQKLSKFLTPPMVELLKMGGFTETKETFSYEPKYVEKLKEMLWLIEKCEHRQDVILDNKSDDPNHWKFLESNEIKVEKDGTMIKFDSSKNAPRTSYGSQVWTTGKYIWELTIVSSATPSNIMIGIANPEVHTNTNAFLSHGSCGWSYYAYYGNSYHDSKSKPFGEPYLAGDLIMVCLDLNIGTCEFYKNGFSQGKLQYDNILGNISPAVTLYSRGDCVSVNTDRNELLMKKKRYDFESTSQFVSENGPMRFKPARGVSVIDNKIKFTETMTAPRTCLGNKLYSTGMNAWEIKILSTGKNVCDIQIGVTDPFKNRNSCTWISNSVSTWAIWGQFGMTVNGGQRNNYGEEDFAQGDVISILLDSDSASMELFKNGEYLGVAFVDILGPVAPFVTIYDPDDQVEFYSDQETIQKILSFKRLKVDHTSGPLKWRRSNGIELDRDGMVATLEIIEPHASTVFANKIYHFGKHMWEVIILKTDSPSNIMIGVCDSSFDRLSKIFLTHGTRGWAYYAYDGTKYFQSKSNPYGEALATGDAITLILDLDKSTLEFFKNGKSQGIAFTDITGPVSPAITLYTPKDSVQLEYDQEIIKKRLEQFEVERRQQLEIENGPLKFRNSSGVEVVDGNMKATMLEEETAITLLGTKVLLMGKLEWEIKIEKTSKPTSIMIGICDPNVGKKSNRGFLSTSRGFSYCGQNGSAYTSAKGKSYGETYGEGDVIRVVVNLDLKTLEFYKNGLYQGIAFKDVFGPITPAITLYSKGDQVILNTDLKEIDRDIKIEMEDLYD